MPTISVYPYATRTELFHLLAVLVLFAAVRNQIASTGSLWRLSLILVINGCLLALFGLVQFFRMKPRGTVYGAYVAAQPFGPFINRNHFAAYLNICIGLGVGLLVWLGPSKEDRKQRYMVKPNAQVEQREVLSVVFSPLIVLHSPPQLWTLRWAGPYVRVADGQLVAWRRGGHFSRPDSHPLPALNLADSHPTTRSADCPDLAHRGPIRLGRIPTFRNQAGIAV